MKKIKSLVVVLIVALCFTNCFEDRDDVPLQSSSINDFVWRGMNVSYLYKNEIPNLANDRFTNNAEYLDYLNSFPKPEDLFESLIFDRQNVDQFSWIVDDYFALEQNFSGISKTNGMEIFRSSAPNNNSDLIGIVRLVLPNSDADAKGVKRGDIFYAIDGTKLNANNFNSLRNQDQYTINLATYNDNGTPNTDDDTIEPTDESITLTKFEYTENPIFKSNIIEIGGENIGYLMYNRFTRGSENELNTVFANFKSNNIQHLVLDLRYNPGGSISTTTFLASMITGQFTGQVFERLIYNETLQNNNLDYLFANELPNGSTVNSLGLNKIYVLTSGGSASASEGIINGLAPYIEVIQIGTNTRGKTQASITIYDSPDFTRDGVNPSHTYAMQPLIANGVNKDNLVVPSVGLPPTITYIERGANLGILGDINEPMLALALNDITGSTSKTAKIKTTPYIMTPIMDENDFNAKKGGLIVD